MRDRAPDDAALVKRALAGSEDAYREIVRRYERPVFGLIVRLVGDRAEAEDLAQEAFLKAFAALAGFDPERRFSSWLFKIAHNTTIDHLRRRRLDTVPLAAGEARDGSLDPGQIAARGESPAAAAERADLARSLESALARLRPEYREVLVLRYREGLTYNEIAEVVDLPLGTVKTHLHRARKELARAVRSLGLAG